MKKPRRPVWTVDFGMRQWAGGDEQQFGVFYSAVNSLLYRARDIIRSRIEGLKAHESTVAGAR